MANERRRLTDDEVAIALANLDGWNVVDGTLHREFKFANFVSAIAFIDRVAVHADALDHHPNWSNVYNRVTVELWTHDLGGISALDFELAHKMNVVAQGI
ncbi:MAG: 4a-hydroxytetrahydrobiopterin dehydratase [Ilumatobacteraceae bacterium]